MKKEFYALVAVSALSLSTVFASAVQAESYYCQVDDRFARGWLPKYVVLAFNEGTKSAGLWGFGKKQGSEAQKTAANPGKFKAHVPAKVLKDDAKRLSFSATRKNVKTNKGSHINVYYSVSILKPSMKLQTSIRIGTQGQKEFGRGNCQKIS